MNIYVTNFNTTPIYFINEYTTFYDSEDIYIQFNSDTFISFLVKKRNHRI